MSITAVEIEFEAAGLVFVSKPRFPVVYRGSNLGGFFPDFIVNDQVIIEVKSASDGIHRFVHNWGAA